MFETIVIVAILGFVVWAYFTPQGKAKMAEAQAEQKQKKLDKQQDKAWKERLKNQPIYDEPVDYSINRYSHEGFDDTSDDTAIYPMTHCMTYTNRNGVSSTRDIGMVRAYRRSKRWYIDAYCYQRDEVRTFAVENIAQLEDFVEGNTYTANNMIREHIKSYA